MESSILIYTVTISWIFLAYSVNKPVLKELLHLIVAINLISIVYTIKAAADIVAFEEIISASEIYLLANTMAFIGFIIFYLIEWTMKWIKDRNKKKNEVTFN